MLGYLIASLTIIGLLLAWRLFVALRRKSLRTRRNLGSTCSLAVFLGSGGHTSEALTLLSALNFDQYTPRTYVISEGDTLSAQKAIALESVKSSNSSGKSYEIVLVPRARYVHQPLLKTLPTALYSLLACVKLVTFAPLRGARFSEVLIVNGPGTCFMLCAAVVLNRVLGLSSPEIIFIESFARVSSLSLSGKLLYPIVDRFVVQWPQLLQAGTKAEFKGWLV